MNSCPLYHWRRKQFSWIGFPHWRDQSAQKEKSTISLWTTESRLSKYHWLTFLLYFPSPFCNFFLNTLSTLLKAFGPECFFPVEYMTYSSMPFTCLFPSHQRMLLWCRFYLMTLLEFFITYSSSFIFIALITVQRIIFY